MEKTLERKDYTQITGPYNNNLFRDSGPLALSLGQNTQSSLSSFGPLLVGEQSAGGNVTETNVKSAGAISDVWINNFIRSTNWIPRKTGFSIDGKSGKAEFSNVYVSGTINALSGTIGGWTINSNSLSGNGVISGGTILGSFISGGSIIGNSISGATITGGIISGTTVLSGTIIGTTIKTSNEINRIELNSEGLGLFVNNITRLFLQGSNDLNVPGILFYDINENLSGAIYDNSSITGNSGEISFKAGEAGMLFSYLGGGHGALSPLDSSRTMDLGIFDPNNLWERWRAGHFATLTSTDAAIVLSNGANDATGSNPFNTNGAIYYNTTSNVIRAKINGAWKTLSFT